MDKKLATLNFGSLVSAIHDIDRHISGNVARAVNVNLTLRNWIIGFYIEEYERRGLDRAEYGQQLMDVLAKALQELGLSRCDRRELYRYRRFYVVYPQIAETVSPQLLAAGANVPLPRVSAPSFAMSGQKLLENLSGQRKACRGSTVWRGAGGSQVGYS